MQSHSAIRLGDDRRIPRPHRRAWLAQITAAREAHDRADRERAYEIEILRDEYRQRLRSILGTHADVIRGARSADADRQRAVAATLRRAGVHGEVERLQADFHRRLGSVREVIPAARLLPEPPRVSVPPQKTLSGPAFFNPPYASWDGLWTWISEGAAQVTFGPTDEKGADVQGNLHDSATVSIESSGDDDFGEVLFDTGVLVSYTPDTSATITATVVLQCTNALASMVVSNEFGVSDSDIWYGFKLTVGIYSPGGYGRDMVWLWSNGYSGSPGNDLFGGEEKRNENPFQAESVLVPQITLSGIHEAGQPLLLHFGVAAHVFVSTNDVSATVSLQSDWRMPLIVLAPSMIFDSGPALNPV